MPKRSNKISSADLRKVRAYIKSVEWRFAKTMPQWPHFYTIFEWNPEKSADYYYFAYLIEKHGTIDPWGSERWSYLVVDDYKYWVLGNVINRAEPKPNAVVIEEGKKYLRAQAKRPSKTGGENVQK